MSRKNRLIRKSLEVFLAAFAVTLFWYLLALYVKNNMLPTPWVVLSEFVSTFRSTLWVHFYISTFRVAASILIALVLAVPLGLYLGREESVDRLVFPVIYLVYPIPKIVFLPLVFLLLGLGDAPKIFMIVLITFFQILVTTRDAAKSVPIQNVYSMTSLGASKFQIYYHVIWPACLPKILTSIRISLGTAIAVLFFVESFATTEGLGYFIMDSWNTASYSQMFTGIIGMSVLGLILYVLLDFIEARWCRWQQL